MITASEAKQMSEKAIPTATINIAIKECEEKIRRAAERGLTKTAIIFDDHGLRERVAIALRDHGYSTINWSATSEVLISWN